MYEIKRFPVTPNLFLWPVVKKRFAKNDGADVTKGGAINGLETRVAARNIYTYTGTW